MVAAYFYWTPESMLDFPKKRVKSQDIFAWNETINTYMHACIHTYMPTCLHTGVLHISPQYLVA